MMDLDLAGTREWGEKAIALAERLGETEVLVAAIRTVGTVELSHGLAQGREKLLRSLELALEAELESHAAVADDLVSCAYDTRDYDTALAHLEAGRAYCFAHDLLAWVRTWAGWEARIALDHGRWADAAAFAGRNLERTARRAAAQPVRLAPRPGVLHARRGDEDPRPVFSTRRWPSPSGRTSWSGSVRWPLRGQRRAGSRARPATSRRDRRRAGARGGERPPLDDRRARDLAPSRRPVPNRRRAPAAAIPGGARRGSPCRRGVLGAHADATTTRRSRSAPATRRTSCARACAPCRAWARAPPRRRRPPPPRARRPRRAARAACRDASEPRRPHRATARRARPADRAATGTRTSPRSCSSRRRPSTTTCRRSCASSGRARAPGGRRGRATRHRRALGPARWATPPKSRRGGIRSVVGVNRRRRSMPVTQDDAELKTRHRAMWASGDYPSNGRDLPAAARPAAGRRVRGRPRRPRARRRGRHR